MAAVTAQLEKLGFEVDVSAYGGLPSSDLEADLKRLLSAVSAASRGEGAVPARRETHILLNARFLPDSFSQQRCLDVEKVLERELHVRPCIRYPTSPAIARLGGHEALPVKLVPRSDSLDALLGDFGTSAETLAEARAPHAGTLWFKPFTDVRLLNRVACPVPALGAETGPIGDPRRRGFVPPALQGKVVSQGKMLDWVRSEILGHGESHLIGEASTFGARPGLYFVKYEVRGRPALWTWGVPVADANGAARWVRGEGNPISAKALSNNRAVHPEFGGRYENAYGGIKWESVGRHSLLVLAKPRPFGSGEAEFNRDWSAIAREDYPVHRSQERLVVTRELLGKHPVLVLRKGKTWHPFMEDADFDARLSFHGSDDSTARLLVLSADASDASLRKVARAYYGLK